MAELPIIKLTHKDYERILYYKYNGVYITELGTFHWENGMNHRLDGPAVIWNNGGKSWWINDKLFHSEKEYWRVSYITKNGLEDYE